MTNSIVTQTPPPAQPLLRRLAHCMALVLSCPVIRKVTARYIWLFIAFFRLAEYAQPGLTRRAYLYARALGDGGQL